MKRWPAYWSWSSSRDGRAILCIILLCYFGVLGSLLAARGWTDAWETLGVSGGALSFADSRFIVATLESHREGYDTYVENPLDPWGRRMNYPRVWLLLSGLPLSEAHGVAAGIVLGSVFLIAAVWWVGMVNPIQALIVAAFLCCPHIMWLVERGNVDIVIFVLLAGGLALAARGNRLRPLLYGAILLAGVLKYYPIAGIWAAARERSWRVAAAWGIALMGAFAGYLWLTRSDLIYTLESTPRWPWWSYGRMVIFEVIVEQFQQRWGIEIARTWVLPGSITSLALAGLLAVFIALRLEAPAVSERRLDGFLVGSGIYAGTFLIGTSFDYKLVFLFFLLPQLFEWLRGGSSSARIGGLLLVAIMLSIWSEAVIALVRGRHSSFPPTTGVLLQEGASWLLLVLVVAVNLRLLLTRWRREARENESSTSAEAEGAA